MFDQILENTTIDRKYPAGTVHATTALEPPTFLSFLASSCT